MVTGLNSTAIDRAPGPSKNFVRGKSGYVPFWPGGLEALLPEAEGQDGMSEQKGLRTVAPGLSRRLKLPGDESEESAALQELDGLKDGMEQRLTVCIIFSQTLSGC